jgi:hypothetical protein
MKKFLPDGDRRDTELLCLLAGLGLAVRAGYVLWTRDAAPHMDLSSFFPSNLPFTHPFDTSPREPFFVWWLWLLSKLGITSVAGIRAVNALWFVPSFFLAFSLGVRLLGARAAWAAAALYAFLPAQVQSDTTGLRHLIEGVCVLLLLNALAADQGLSRLRGWWRSAAALAVLVLTRVNYAGSGLLVTAAAARERRTWRPLLALLPALLLLSGHLWNNSARHGDPLYSVNLHTYSISNLEFIGQPGFPASFDEWQEDVYKPRLNFRQWAFERHTPWELARDSAIGMSRGIWDFYEKVYFSLSLPVFARYLLLSFYVLGFAAALADPRLRLVPLWLLLFTLPYAFPAHVFWAGRFFMPFTPLALMLTVLGAGKVGGLILERAGGLRVRLLSGDKV